MSGAEMVLGPEPEAMTVGPMDPELKAERVQIRLRGMPAWSLLLNGRSIRRTREFKETYQAEAFSAFVVRITMAERQPATIDLVDSRVLVTLHGPTVNGATGDLTEAVLDIADAIG